MPIYDYQCTSCGHKAEVMRKISAASTEACPSCGAETFSKQLSAPSFQLSGSGWYATDFKNGGKSAPAAKSETSTEKKSEVAAAPAACATGCACH
jgi:putative FmdB family regulatory protein